MAEIMLDIEENATSVDMELDEAQTVLENDHEKLIHRDAENSHPISAISGLSDKLREVDQAIEDNKVQLFTTKETEEILNAE